MTDQPERGVLASVPEQEWADISPECDWHGHTGCPGCDCGCHPENAAVPP